jgi:hypothetical protein
LFLDLPEQLRVELAIPPGFPTDPQAEVLVFNTIAPTLIQAVYFSDPALLYHWQQSYPLLSLPKLEINRHFLVDGLITNIGRMTHLYPLANQKQFLKSTMLISHFE